jgi:hypothetical protein
LCHSFSATKRETNYNNAASLPATGSARRERLRIQRQNTLKLAFLYDTVLICFPLSYNNRPHRDATAGYRSEYGNVNTYRNYFREGFRRGYADGYQNRTTRTGRWGDILGDILGRP